MSNAPPPPPPLPGEPVQGHTPLPPPPPPGLQPPPGYVAYGAAPTPAARLGRVGGLTKAITILIGLAAAVNAIVAALSQGAQDAAQEFLDGETSSSEFTNAILGYTLVQAVSGLVMLAAMVVVMIWMYRMASNIRAYGTSTTWHPLWAVFGWFLPPVLFIIPLLMLRELWSKSAHRSGNESAPGGENITLWVWFALFGVLPLALTILQAGSFADQFSAQGAETQAGTLVDAGAFAVVGPLATIAASVAWIVFARQLSKRHTAMTGER